MFGLSSAERQFLIDGVELNVRNDGRSRLDFRHFTIETGIIATANGSARLKLDNTDVMVGVRVDLAEPKLDRPNEGKISAAQ
jgi:exosome complex component RRP42